MRSETLILYCIELLAELLSGACFALPMWDSPSLESNSYVSTAGFIVIYSLFVNTNNCRFQRSVAFPITCKTKFKNGSLPSLAVLKYHSHLITCPPHQTDESIEKWAGSHNVVAR